MIQIESPSTKPVTAGPNWEAFLSLGFRPLYIAGATWALISVCIWVYFPAFTIGKLNGVWWHAHEMLWGFVATIATAFLLTASATWTGLNPAKDKFLAVISLCWVLARILYLLPTQFFFILAAIFETAFYMLSAYALGKVIFKARSKRNYILPIALFVIGLANIAYLGAVHTQNVEFLYQFFELGILAMSFIVLVIARRVIPFFAMRGAGLDIPLHQHTGKYQLWACGIAIIGAALGFHYLVALGIAIAGIIALYQLWAWQPLGVIKVPLLWVLYISYFFFGVGLILGALHFIGLEPIKLARAASHIHVLAMGGFSIMIMGMITRTALGHTGHPLKADKWMVTSYVLITLATLVRLISLYPNTMTVRFWHLAAFLWALAFIVYLIRFVPILIRHRADHPGLRKKS